MISEIFWDLVCISLFAFVFIGIFKFHSLKKTIIHMYHMNKKWFSLKRMAFQVQYSYLDGLFDWVNAAQHLHLRPDEGEIVQHHCWPGWWLCTGTLTFDLSEWSLFTFDLVKVKYLTTLSTRIFCLWLLKKITLIQSSLYPCILTFDLWKK